MFKFGSVIVLVIVSSCFAQIEIDVEEPPAVNNAPPVPGASILNQLKNIRSTAEFLKHLKIKTEDIQQITGLNLTLAKNASGGDDRMASSSADALADVLAVPAACEPRDTEVEIPRENPMVYVWPTCTKVRRCGGCCGHEMLKCVAKPKVGISETKVKVMKAQYPAMGSSSFEFATISEVAIESHTECQCQCRMLETDCNPRQEYIPNECRCQCKDNWMAKKCDRAKEWDPVKCACVCRKRYRCDTYEKFDENTCRCAFKRLASARTKNTEITDTQQQSDPNELCAAELRCPDGFLAISSLTGCECQPAVLINEASKDNVDEDQSTDSSNTEDIDLEDLDISVDSTQVDLDLDDLAVDSSEVDLGDLDLGDISLDSLEATGGNVHSPSDRRRK
ncbi:uncharacterized protein LOC141905619 [Tubulanus polymorphus]|uniref:uncharacterized protein LOC141905619 n=1 Tax=Tubulanus polymorphus TaxID=672921 RepID=UPI003DA4CF5B